MPQTTQNSSPERNEAPESIDLDSTDLDIIAALHAAPRITAAALGGIIGVPTSTVSRRIARLQHERILRVVGRYSWSLITSSNPYELWITSFPGRSNEVVTALQRIPDVQAIVQTTGSQDIYANLYPLRGSSGAELLMEQIPSIPGVSAIDSHMILETAKVGQSWRYDRLPPDVVAELEAEAQVESLPPIADLDDLSDLEFDVMRLLGSDGRISAAAAARELGVSTSTTARAIRMLLATGAVTCRVEVQPELIGFPLWGFMTLEVDPQQITDAMATIAGHPSVRLLCTVTGDAPVSVSGSFTGPDDFGRFIREDVGTLPGIRSVATATGLRGVRRYWVDRDGMRLLPHSQDVLRR